MGGHRRVPSWVRVLGVVVVIVLAAVVGWWAGRATFSPSVTASTQQQTQVAVTVTRASVGQTLRLNVTVTQAYQPLAPVLLSGIVTDVPAAGASEAGQVMFRVDDVPVRVIQGATPFYRDLGVGLRGADVTELQQALVTLGFLTGAPSGTFDVATAAAVEKWQASLGQPATGEVKLGELIAVPSLPPTLRLGDGITLGAQVGPGQPAVLARRRSGVPAGGLPAAGAVDPVGGDGADQLQGSDLAGGDHRDGHRSEQFVHPGDESGVAGGWSALRG